MVTWELSPTRNHGANGCLVVQGTLRQRLDRSDVSALEEGILQDPLKLHKVHC